VHGVDANGAAILKRKLRRNQGLAFFERLDPCLVGMEVCAGAHFRAREGGFVPGKDRPPHYWPRALQRSLTRRAGLLSDP